MMIGMGENIARQLAWDLGNMEIVGNSDHRYLVGTIFFGAAWLLLFWRAPASRKVMLWSSPIIMMAAPVFDYLNTKDYWEPVFALGCKLDLPEDAKMTFGIEGFVLGFTVVGLSAGIFDVLHRRRGAKVAATAGVRSFGRLWLVTVAGVSAILVIHFLFGANSVRAHVYACALLTAGGLWYWRPAWIPEAAMTAGVMALFMALFYYAFFLLLYPGIIGEWWMLDHMWFLIAGVPVEEFLWAGANAAYLGAAVRYCLEPDLTSTRKLKSR